MTVNIFDVILLAIILFFVFHGYAKGLIVSILRFVALIGSVIVAKIFEPMVSNYFFGTKIFQWLDGLIIEKLADLQAKGKANFLTTLENVANGKEDGIVAKILGKALEDGTFLDQSNIIDFISQSLTSMIIRIGAFIGLFVLALIAFAIIIFIAKGIVSLPVIKQMDKLGGLIFGLLEGVIVSYILVMLVALFNFGGVSGGFQDTYLVKWFLYFNPFI